MIDFIKYVKPKIDVSITMLPFLKSIPAGNKSFLQSFKMYDMGTVYFHRNSIQCSLKFDPCKILLETLSESRNFSRLNELH